MGQKTIDLLKLFKYIMKRCWLVIICAAIGFGAMYYYVKNVQKDAFAASATMYVYNGNPNVVNYQYVSTNDLNSAYQLLDTYMVVVKSNKVLDSVADRIASDYPGITAEQIRRTLSMGSVNETGVLKIVCTTGNPQLSADICNAIADVAPSEIIRVVSAGSVEIIDYAQVPVQPVDRGPMKKGVIGALAGAVLAGGLLILLFLFNRKVTDVKDLENNYTPPVLASITRAKKEEANPKAFLINSKSSLSKLESYAKLRMNLMYTMSQKKNNVVAITSAISGEGKSTITANLAISYAMSNWNVLVVDADLRRACQHDVFAYDDKLPGVSEILIGQEKWQDCVLHTKYSTLDILPAGQLPPNPSEMLSSVQMKELLETLGKHYKLILLDVPPINIVSDPLALSDLVAGSIFVVRQNYSDHREIRQALISAEMTHMDVMGFVFFGEKVQENKYYSKKHYEKYYSKYDNRAQARAAREQKG